jgi:hypothetical protein
LKEKVETKIVNKQKQIDFATYAPVTVGAPTGMFNLKILSLKKPVSYHFLFKKKARRCWVVQQ